MTDLHYSVSDQCPEAGMNGIILNHISRLNSLLEAAQEAIDEFDEDSGTGPIIRARDLIYFAINQADIVRETTKEMGTRILAKRIAA